MESVPTSYLNKLESNAYKEMELITIRKIINTLGNLKEYWIFDDENLNANHIINSYLGDRINLNEFYETL